jgi:hypothetical protein
MLSDTQCVAMNLLQQDATCTDEDVKKMKMEVRDTGTYHQTKESWLRDWKVGCGTCAKSLEKMFDTSRRARALSPSTGQLSDLGRRLGGHIMSDEKCAAVDDFDATCAEEDFKDMAIAYDMAECKVPMPDEDAKTDQEREDYRDTCEKNPLPTKAEFLFRWKVGCGTCGKGFAKMHESSRRARALSPSPGQLSDLGRRLGGHIMSDAKCAAVDDFDATCTEEGFKDMATVYEMAECKVPLTEAENEAMTDQEKDNYGNTCEKNPLPTKAEYLAGSFKVWCGPCAFNYHKFVGEDDQAETTFTASTEQCAAVFDMEARCTEEELDKWLDHCGNDGQDPCPTVSDIVGRYIEGNPTNLEAQCTRP